MQSKQEPVALLGCVVNPSRQGDKDLEIILKNYSVIESSPRKFDPQQCQPTKREIIKLEEIKDVPNFHEIATTAKAISVHKPIVAASGKRKQDIILVDGTATAPLTLWEKAIGHVSEGDTYTFTNLLVRMFQSKKQLSAPKHATITKTDDLADVATVG